MELEEALKKITELEVEKTELQEATNNLKSEVGEYQKKLSDEAEKYIKLGNSLAIEKGMNERMTAFFNNSKPKEPEKTEAEVKAEAYDFLREIKNPKKEENK